MRDIGRTSAVTVTAFSLGLALYLANLGCGGGGPSGEVLGTSNVELRMLPQALLVTDGVRIEFVEDGGRSVSSGAPFTPTSYFPVVPVASSVEPGDLRTYAQADGYFGIDFAQSSAGRLWIRHVVPGSPADRAGLRYAEIESVNGVDMDSTSELWPHISMFHGRITSNLSATMETSKGPVTLTAATATKPAKVLVHVPGRAQPLYGRLAFFPVYSSAEGSASRVYRIAVPDSYIQAATGGAVSVVYQPYDWTDTIWLGGSSSKRTAVSWALWMSDVPI